MHNINTDSYKTKFILIYLFGALFVLSLIFLQYKMQDKSDVSTVSKEHLKNQFIEREEYFHDFFYPYLTSLKALKENIVFKDYINSKLNKEIIENIFLQTKKSLPYIQQLRYIDKNGMENIRIEGTPIGVYKDKSISKIVSTNKLQNKAHRYYFQEFIKLKDGKVGISKIDLNIEHKKIVIPKQPVIRLGMSVYDNNKELKGILTYNVCLISFLEHINKTTLYHMHLIDKNGQFINHHNKNYGLLGENSHYSLKEEFPLQYLDILSNDEFYGKNFYSNTIKNFNNGQSLKILLELKFDKLTKEKDESKNYFIIFIVALSILLLPIVIYMAKIPDFLKKEVNKSRYNSYLTSLPNRLALMEDLNNGNYEKSIIILISINNIIKIQNTYGHGISDKLVLDVAEYLQSYEDENLEKIYMNNYHIFSLKYKYKDNKTLEDFLRKFQNDIENKIFNAHNLSMEFSIHTTLGISDPNNLNNSMDELQEAENALDAALEKNVNYVIYSSHHLTNIERNHANIQVAQQIKKALEEELFVIYFQPIYNNKRKQIEKYECLIRMKYNGKIKSPDEFLRISKDINKYELISYFVIENSCRYFTDKDYEFSINLSVLDIENTNFQNYLFDTIDKYDVSSKIVLEIVESEGIDNYDNFYDFIIKAKKIGCKVAIDDFGTGYSNFEYITKLSEYIDYLKIDGALIKNIIDDSKNQMLVASLKYLCSHLGIKIIAEYVENEEVLKYLTYMGIEYSQGYFIGKPEKDIVS